MHNRFVSFVIICQTHYQVNSDIEHRYFHVACKEFPSCTSTSYESISPID